MRAFSERLGMLSSEQLQAALDRFGLGRLIKARPADSGLFGQNVFVTSDRGEWVFRGAPHWPWQFAKERWFAERAHAQTSAPVPWPYRVETSTELFGWGFAWMPRLPGTPPDRLREHVGGEDLTAIAGAMGAGLAELHGATAPETGEYDPEGGGIRAEPSFAVWVIRTLERWRVSTLEIPGAFDEKDVALFDALVRDNRAALEEPFQPCVVHYDYKEGNVLVEPDLSDGWRLSGIFDLMTCAVGDGEQDLSRAMTSLAVPDPAAARAFVAAYRARRPFRPGYRERFRLYMLMDRMMIWEYARRNGVWFPTEARFRDFLGESLALESLLDA